MFGFLKKKLKEGIEKITKKVEKEEQVQERTKEKLQKPKKVAKEKPKKVKKSLFNIGKRIIRESDIKDVLWDLQISLLESDVALETAEKICNDLKKNLVGKEIKKKDMEITIRNTLKNSLKEILDQKQIDILAEVKKKKPFLILFLGFNGAGKTTAIARVAYLLKSKGLSVNMAAGDTWRAAAINQLEKHGAILKVPVIKHDYGADSAAVIYDAVKHAKAREIDVVLADTAGRSHTNKNLMNELEKICRVNKPDMKILVVDSLTGNDSVEQAKAFESSVGIDGVIMTKMDVNEKGGAAISVAHAIKKPILYIGVGQDYKDLEKFDADKIIKNLLE